MSIFVKAKPKFAKLIYFWC